MRNLKRANKKFKGENGCTKNGTIQKRKRNSPSDYTFNFAFVSCFKFILFLITLYFSDKTVCRKWQGKKTQLRSQSFILGYMIQELTHLPRTGKFIKLRRSYILYSRVVGPTRSQPRIHSNSYISLENSCIFRKLKKLKIHP